MAAAVSAGETVGRLKVAVVHDWLGPMTGAERVLDHILRCYPGADVFTAIDFLHARDRSVLHGSRVVTSFIQHLPRARTSYWNYVPLMPLAFERFDLGDYDLVISNSHAVAKGVRTRARQTHVCYLLTPMRFAWDLEAYYLERFGMYGVKRALARLVLAWMRRWDAAGARRVDRFLAASRFVGDRCSRYYGRDSTLLYPPVDVDYYAPGDSPKSDFYLAASRLTPFKRVDLLVDAFRAMPDRQLVVIGDGPERERIKVLSTGNVTWFGPQPDHVLRDHMQRARAFLFAPPEDFGIVMAEAQACGTAVIAFGVGGAAEIVRDLDVAEPTGVLFGEQTVASVCDAVRTFERNAHRITPAACRANSLRFTPSAFRQGLTRFVAEARAEKERQ